MFLTGLPDFKGLVASLQNVRLLKIGTVCKNLIFDDSRHFGTCLKVTHFYRLLTLTVLVSAVNFCICTYASTYTTSV